MPNGEQCVKGRPLIAPNGSSVLKGPFKTSDHFDKSVLHSA